MHYLFLESLFRERRIIISNTSFLLQNFLKRIRQIKDLISELHEEAFEKLQNSKGSQKYYNITLLLIKTLIFKLIKNKTFWKKETDNGLVEMNDREIIETLLLWRDEIDIDNLEVSQRMKEMYLNVGDSIIEIASLINRVVRGNEDEMEFEKFQSFNNEVELVIYKLVKRHPWLLTQLLNEPYCSTSFNKQIDEAILDIYRSKPTCELLNRAVEYITEQKRKSK